MVAGAVTVGIEYAWYALATGIPAERVVAANLEWMWPLRPAWNVFLAGVFMVVILPFGKDGTMRVFSANLMAERRLRPQHSRGG